MAFPTVLAVLATVSTFSYAPPPAKQVPFNPGRTFILEHTIRVAEHPTVTGLKQSFTDLTQEFNKPGLTEARRQEIARQIIERATLINSNLANQPLDTTAPFMGQRK